MKFSFILATVIHLLLILIFSKSYFSSDDDRYYYKIEVLDLTQNITSKNNLENSLSTSIDGKKTNSKKLKNDAILSNTSGKGTTLLYEAKLKKDLEFFYPIKARERHIEGEVILKAYININGKVDKIEIVKTSGHKELDDAARKSVLFAEFFPATLNGKTVDSIKELKINFVLN